MSNPGLAAYFDRHFEALPARDDGARSEVFRMRYAVYCEELRYEDASAFPDGLEHDEYDPDAEFALLRHRASGRFAACVRLILNQAHPQRLLPFEQVCAGRLDPARLDLAAVDRRRIGEISRLAVHRHFRRREGESSNPEGAMEPHSFVGSRRYPLVATGLFMAATALALQRDLDQVFVMMEPRLARLLRGCGIRFTQLGDVVDYHGWRGPFGISRGVLDATLPEEAQELLRMLAERLR